MIGSFGEVLVMDWGLAKVASDAVSMRDPAKIPTNALPAKATGAGGVLGTQGYMSPEQLRGDREIDQRTDIFSLGAVLLFLLDAPNPADQAQISARALRPLHAVCRKAMSPAPTDRYQSAAELSEDVGRYLSGSSPIIRIFRGNSRARPEDLLPSQHSRHSGRRVPAHAAASHSCRAVKGNPENG